MTTRRRPLPPAEEPSAERLAKLPGYAQDYIRSLRSQLSYAEARLDSIERQLAIAKGEEQAEDTNVRLDMDDIAVGLPAEATVTFCEEISAAPLGDGTGIMVRLIPLGNLVVTIVTEDEIEIRKRDKK